MRRVAALKAVDTAIREVERRVKLALKDVNQEAARQLTRGRYSQAESLVELAKRVRAFQSEIAAIRTRWREVKGASRRRPAKQEATALWELYRPVLRALDELGGQARKTAIIQHLGAMMDGKWKAGDLEPNTRGTPRWQQRVGWTRKHLAKEGWIEEGARPVWRITPSGRRAAKASGR